MSLVGRNLLLVLVILLPLSAQQSCDSFLGSQQLDYALPGYTFDCYTTNDVFSCALRCLSHDRCKSCNYALSGPQRGLCELNSEGRHASNRLQYRPGFVFVQVIVKQKLSTHKTIKATPSAPPTASSSVSIPSQQTLFKSCVDHWKDGKRLSGQYPINHNNSGSFNASCDFASESGWVWTLVMSQSHTNRAMPELRSTPLYKNTPISENTPNWAAHRLSLDRMKALQSESTHWRITCSFPAHGIDYRDYVRANFTELDPLTFQGEGICKKTEYMNVRGHDCTGCTSAWWQQSGRWFIHHDSSMNWCEFGSTPGAVGSEDNFGYYCETNPSFRCSSSNHSTTNHWFGRRVA